MNIPDIDVNSYKCTEECEWVSKTTIGPDGTVCGVLHVCRTHEWSVYIPMLPMPLVQAGDGGRDVVVTVEAD